MLINQFNKIPKKFPIKFPKKFPKKISHKNIIKYIK